MSDGDARWAGYEQDGEQAVRKNLALRVYGEDDTKLAKAWLEHQSSLSNAATQAETLSLAREAQKDASRAAIAAERAAAAAAEALVCVKRHAEAADRQARAAESAERRATIAVAISIISIGAMTIIAIISLQFAGAH